MKSEEILSIFGKDELTAKICTSLGNSSKSRIHLTGLISSARSLLAATVFGQDAITHTIILPDKESAAYFLNDIKNILGEQTAIPIFIV